MFLKTKVVILFVFVAAAAISQPEVTTERLSMMRGVYDALVIDIAHPKSSFAEREWRDFMSKYGKVEKVRKTNEWLLQSAHLVNYPDIEYVNVYSEALEKDSTVRFAAWFETDTVFLSAEANAKAWESAITLMEDFAVKVTMDLILEELDEEQKSLDKLQSELDRLEKNHEKYVETIDRAHNDITKAEADIVGNATDQEALTVEMQSYTNLEGDPDAQKVMKKLEKDMRRLKKQNLSYHNSIASDKERIIQNESNIEQNTVDQAAKKEEIAAQEAVVAEVRTRLDAIRALGVEGIDN